MNLSGKSLFQTKNISDDNNLDYRNETTDRPYTSAPRMANSFNYDELIEIPLSNSILEPTNISCPEKIDKTCHLNAEFVSSTVCNLNISPSDQFSESILAVDELLKCSTKMEDSKLTMPYVEDGLSSESEVNSPKISPKQSYNPDNNRNESLINTNLMKCITKDIDDLRKAINGNMDILKDQNYVLRSTSLSKQYTDNTNALYSGVDSKLSQAGQISSSYTNRPATSDNKRMFEDSKELTFQLDEGNEIRKDCGKYNKVTRKGCEINFPLPPSTKSSEPNAQDPSWNKLDKFCRDRNEISFDQLEAQHWTFPIASHTVYSSSSSDDHDTDCETKCRVEVPANDINSIKFNNSSGEKSKILKTFKSLNFSNNFQQLNQEHDPVEKIKIKSHGEYESDEDTDKLLLKQYEHNGKIDIPELKEKNDLECERKRKGKDVTVRHPDYPSVLIEGLLFRANYLGSTQLQSEIKPSRDTRMIQAQEAVGRVKAPDSESQPSVAVDLFVSAEKILVLNTNLSEIMMDHNLKTISYIADIGDILVLMARRISPSHQFISETSQFQNKILCHVFESDEAQVIAQSIGNAFQVAYIEYLKANGIDDPNIFKEVDYQDVLNDQEILTDELKMFSNKEQHKKVIIPKQRGEQLGVVVVESGWGSMLPTVVLANMNPNGPAARCGFLNIGNQIISVNDNSLVGLPLNTCQQIIKKCRTQTAVKLTVVNCLPVVEVHIRRPDSKYQLGFSVQNGVICSLLRGGIAERGGVRVGHHIIEINGISVVAMSHEKIVNLLATAVGEIHLRTMPTSIFRLLTGQDTPHYI